MWNLILTLMAIGLFAGVTLMHETTSMNSIEQAALHAEETSAAAMLNQIAQAGATYIAANNPPPEVSIHVSTLISAGYLPAGFPSQNAFGQTPILLPVTTPLGTSGHSFLVYYQHAPTVLSDRPLTFQNEYGAAMGIAMDLSDMEQGQDGYTAGVDYGPIGQVPTPITLPYSRSQIFITPSAPVFYKNFPDPIIMVNVVP